MGLLSRLLAPRSVRRAIPSRVRRNQPYTQGGKPLVIPTNSHAIARYRSGLVADLVATSDEGTTS